MTNNETSENPSGKQFTQGQEKKTKIIADNKYGSLKRPSNNFCQESKDSTFTARANSKITTSGN